MTLKQLEKMTTAQIVKVETQGKWVIATFETGVRFKFSNF
jgi:hypothetical protein